MGKKRNYDSGDELPENGAMGEHVPQVRSRRERVVKKPKNKSDDEDFDDRHSSQDSGCGEHYSPTTNVEETQRLPEGNFMFEAEEQPLSSVATKRAPAKKLGTRAPPLKKPRAKAAEGAAKKVPGGIFKTAAETILRQTKKLMKTKTIYDMARAQGLIHQSLGKTPDHTMASALYTDMKRKKGKSLFVRPVEGLFGLREWLQPGNEILTDKERELVVAMDLGLTQQDQQMVEHSDMDSDMQFSDFHQDAQEIGTPRKAAKKTANTKRENTTKKALAPRGTMQKRNAASKLQRPRSASVPPDARRRSEQRQQQQPALSGPAVIMEHGPWRALLNAVEQMSGDSNTSNRSGVPSETDSEEEGVKLEHFMGNGATLRAFAEPENSVHAPEAEGCEGKPEVAKPKNVGAAVLSVAANDMPQTVAMPIQDVANLEATLTGLNPNHPVTGNLEIAQLYVGLADAYLKVGDTKKSEEARNRAQACMEVLLESAAESPLAVAPTPPGTEAPPPLFAQGISPPQTLSQ